MKRRRTPTVRALAVIAAAAAAVIVANFALLGVVVNADEPVGKLRPDAVLTATSAEPPAETAPPAETGPPAPEPGATTGTTRATDTEPDEGSSGQGGGGGDHGGGDGDVDD